jgi:hypothetical protein
MHDASCFSWAIKVPEIQREDAWSSRCITVKWQWVYKPQQIVCNLTDIVSMHGGVHNLKEAKICKAIPTFHQVHLLFSTSAPRPKLPSFFVDLFVKRNKNEVRTKAYIPKHNSGPL